MFDYRVSKHPHFHEGGRDGGQLVRQAVNFLVQVRLRETKDAAFGEPIWLRGDAVLPGYGGCTEPATAPARVFCRAGWCAFPDRRYQTPYSPAQSG